MPRPILVGAALATLFAGRCHTDQQKRFSRRSAEARCAPCATPVTGFLVVTVNKKERCSPNCTFPSPWFRRSGKPVSRKSARRARDGRVEEKPRDSVDGQESGTARNQTAARNRDGPESGSRQESGRPGIGQPSGSEGRPESDSRPDQGSARDQRGARGEAGAGFCRIAVGRDLICWCGSLKRSQAGPGKNRGAEPTEARRRGPGSTARERGIQGPGSTAGAGPSGSGANRRARPGW